VSKRGRERETERETEKRERERERAREEIFEILAIYLYPYTIKKKFLKEISKCRKKNFIKKLQNLILLFLSTNKMPFINVFSTSKIFNFCNFTMARERGRERDRFLKF